MSYTAVAIYDLEANFIGYTIKGPNKLQTTNIYASGEEAALNEQLDRLNINQNLKAHWPEPNDPDVLALLENDEFYPPEYYDQEVIDEEASRIVWQYEAERDDDGNATGNLVSTGQIDDDQSQVVYKIVKVASPSSVLLRTKMACEAVARYRSS